MIDVGVSVKNPDFTGSVRAGAEQSPKTQTEKQNIFGLCSAPALFGTENTFSED